MWIPKLLISLAYLVSFGNANFPILAPEHIAENPLSDDMIDFINSAGASWTAGRNFQPDTDLKYLKRLCGLLRDHDHKEHILPERHHNREDVEIIPDEFDARTQWPDCPSLMEIRDQGGCGSCWAVATTSAMTDRWCIATKGDQFRFSAEDLLSCCWACGDGCNGGFTEMAWLYWGNKGVVSGGSYGSHEGCSPYEIPPVTNTTGPSHTPKCVKFCEDDYDKTYKEDLHFGRDFDRIFGNSSEIQLEIIKNGPVVAGFKVYEDFMNYKSGVYHHVTGKDYGEHAVKLLGWGVENETSYWLAANSWGDDWGDDGFFKILRGSNECDIEEMVDFALPKV